MVKFDNLLLNREQDALISADFTLDQKHHAAGKSSRCLKKQTIMRLTKDTSGHGGRELWTCTRHNEQLAFRRSVTYRNGV